MSANSSRDSDFASLRSTLLSRFESELREQRDIDAASRESMLAHMEQALDSMATPQGAADAEQIRSSVAETIGMLHQHGLIDPSGTQHVEEAFAGTYGVFENEGVKRALEFARISREEGEDAARAWLVSQRDTPQQSAA